jgi:hypothetical protein
MLKIKTYSYISLLALPMVLSFSVMADTKNTTEISGNFSRQILQERKLKTGIQQNSST